MAQNNIRDPPRISVVVRKRPLSEREISKDDLDIIEKRDDTNIIVKERKEKVDLTRYIEQHLFTFDAVFNDTVGNEQLYLEAVQPLVAATFEGSKTTVFAYGQTGSGKTHTMMGNPNQGINGMYLLAAKDIFHLLEQEEFQCIELFVSFYEIYCSKLFDLLNKRKFLHCRADAKERVQIQGLKESNVTTIDELMKIISYGLSVRTTGVTGANVDSSRSHAVLQITFKIFEGYKGYAKQEKKYKLHSKMSFIDLAGSERGADTIDQDKKTRIDGAEINKSLLALKECIRAIDQEKKHTPFRGSKLTQVLKDSFIGNCRTVMIANVSPGLSCSEHTLNTLRYADRVKELKKMKSAPISKEDHLAKMLMLPRQKGNATKIKMNSKGEEIHQPSAFKKPNLHREVSAKMPKTNNFVEERKREYDEDDYMEEYEDAYQVVAASKPPIQEYDSPSDEEIARLCSNHENLIDLILEEEEEVTNSHKEQIDSEVETVKEEMKLLYEVQKPNSDIKSYVETLHAMLDQKIRMMMDLKMKVEQFGEHLVEEEIERDNLMNILKPREQSDY